MTMGITGGPALWLLVVLLLASTASSIPSSLRDPASKPRIHKTTTQEGMLLDPTDLHWMSSADGQVLLQGMPFHIKGEHILPAKK